MYQNSTKPSNHFETTSKREAVNSARMNIILLELRDFHEGYSILGFHHNS